MNKKIHPLWHVLYAAAIVASLVYWKKQHDLHNAWLTYAAPTNKGLVDFLEQDCNYLQRSIEKQCKDYPGRQPDSIRHLVDTLCGAADVFNKICKAPVATIDLSELANKWQVYTTIFSEQQIKDTLLTPEVRHLLTPEAFSDWQGIYKSANEAEKQYLLNGLQRVLYTTAYIALNHQLEVVGLFEYNLQFDKMKIAMNTRSRPVAGKPFSVEFYPVWYTSHTDNITARIDGRKYMFKDGIAHCDTVYTTPGQKKVMVQIDVKNPATGAVESVKKEFSIDVE